MALSKQAKAAIERNKLRLEETRGRHYPDRLPKVIPMGEVLVHNQVRPSRIQGMRGARYWLQELSGKPLLELCDCGWCPELGPHYRVAAIKR